VIGTKAPAIKAGERDQVRRVARLYLGLLSAHHDTMHPRWRQFYGQYAAFRQKGGFCARRITRSMSDASVRETIESVHLAARNF
jgi:hypothetical protein